MPRTILIAALTVVNLVSFLVRSVAFKWSAMSDSTAGFVRWQIVGNFAGFLTVLSLTGLLKFISLRDANAITVGLSFILVQVIGAHLIFHEPVDTLAWVGSGLIVAGIALVSLRS
jgi:multidrug transporter EmrE-like cation transporter